MKRFYQMAQAGRQADIYIFGDIVTPDEKSWSEFWGDASPTSGLSLVNDISGLDVDVINVHINSYGGVVSEGLAIYNVLKQHKSKIRTYCDGFACSAASVIFMAGTERIMGEASLLMIHNAWSYAGGNAKELRKAADDLDAISSASAAAYKAAVNISEEKLAELLDNETWILPADAVSMGFATAIANEPESLLPAASAKTAMFSRMTSNPTVTLEARTVEPLDVKRLAETLAEQFKALAEEKKETPAENKTIKFLNALMTGRKD